MSHCEFDLITITGWYRDVEGTYDSAAAAESAGKKLHAAYGIHYEVKARAVGLYEDLSRHDNPCPSYLQGY
jgi:hypothetical protein